jgi:hypothetical protein
MPHLPLVKLEYCDFFIPKHDAMHIFVREGDPRFHWYPLRYRVGALRQNLEDTTYARWDQKV